MANKTIKFETKIFHNSKVYLKVSDVAKVFNMKVTDFKQSHSNMIKKIPSCGDCISETDFNYLLADDSNAMKKQRQLAEIKRCKSIEEYITKYELPGEMDKALQEILQNYDRNIGYVKMVDYLFHDKDGLNIEYLRLFGLDVQVLTSIQCDGKMDLDAFVVGKGVFHRVTDLGDYEQWNNLCTNGVELILPYCDYDSSNPEEKLINLSQSGIDRDFREHTVIENMIWCIENLPVTEIEDYEYDVIGCDLDTIKFSVPIELLIKMIRSDAVSTLFIDKVVDVDNECYLTDVKDMEVFAE